MARLSRRRVALAAGKIALREFMELLESNRKAMPEHNSKRPPDEAGLGLGFLGWISTGSIRSAKITYVQTEHPGDPADVITWQSSAE